MKPAPSSRTEELIAQHKNLVYAVLHRHYPHKSNDEDYIQIGTIGLWHAAERYQDGFGKFSTYAYACIRRELSAQDRQDNRGKRKAVLPGLSLSDESARSFLATGSFEDDLISSFRAEEVLARIRANNPRQAYVLTQRMNGRTNAELAEEMHVSRQRISQLCSRASRYLKEGK